MNQFKDNYYLDNNLFDINFLEKISETIEDFNSDITEEFNNVKKRYYVANSPKIVSLVHS
jgi:hypothetical protein